MRRCAQKLGLQTFLLSLSILAVGSVSLPAGVRSSTVHCDDNLTISSALKTLDPQANNTVRVRGTCQPSIGISGFAQPAIVGITGGGNSAVINALDGRPVFSIAGSHVQSKNLTIHGGLEGVRGREFSVCGFSAHTIEAATGRGVELDSADATFQGDVIQNNANDGLQFTASRARVTQVTGKGTQSSVWDDGKGTSLHQGSSITVEQLSVQDDQGAGISLLGGSCLTNRAHTGAVLVTNNANSGVWVTTASGAIIGGATVTNNPYAGMIITGNSEADFGGGGTFTGNQNSDVYGGPLNGVAGSPQSATIGNAHRPHTY